LQIEDAQPKEEAGALALVLRETQLQLRENQHQMLQLEQRLARREQAERNEDAGTALAVVPRNRQHAAHQMGLDGRMDTEDNALAMVSRPRKRGLDIEAEEYIQNEEGGVVALVSQGRQLSMLWPVCFPTMLMSRFRARQSCPHPGQDPHRSEGELPVSASFPIDRSPRRPRPYGFATAWPLAGEAFGPLAAA
jgi:hypothetical protein